MTASVTITSQVLKRLLQISALALVIPFAIGATSNDKAEDTANKDSNQAQTKSQTQAKDDKSEKMRQRLEQIFIWRVADRLQLTPQEEEEFTKEFKKLSQERTKNSQELDLLLEQAGKVAKDKSQAGKLLSAYQNSLKKSSQLQIKELDTMKHLLGAEKSVEYLALKHEMTQKFKDILTQHSSAKQAEHRELKEPEVIQEK